MALRFSTLFGPQSRLVCTPSGQAGQQVLPHLPTGGLPRNSPAFPPLAAFRLFSLRCAGGRTRLRWIPAPVCTQGDFRAASSGLGADWWTPPQVAESGIVHRIHAAADMMNIFLSPYGGRTGKTAVFSGHYFLAPAVRAGGPSGETGV